MGFTPNCPYYVPNESGTQPVITAIVLPNGQQYSFSYDSTYGLVNQITYPNGGWVKYTWGLNSQAAFGTFPDSNGSQYGCAYTYGMPAVTSRTVSFDGVNVALTQSYSYSTTWASGGWVGIWTNKQTVVTTTDYSGGPSYTTTYNYLPVTIPTPPSTYSIFAGQAPVEQNVTTVDSGTNTLRTVNKNWVDQYEMQGQQVADNGTVTSDQFTEFVNTAAYAGIEVADQYECGSGQTCYCGSAGLNSNGICNNFGSSQTSSSPPTSYTRRTHIQYQSFSATQIYPASPSILDRPLCVVTCSGSANCYSGSSNRVAETDYNFDGGALTGASGYPGHDDTNYPASYTNRGNATSKTEWLNTGGTSPQWTYTFDQTGQMLSMVDPCGNTTCSDNGGGAIFHTTNYTYSNSNAYLASITYPPTTVAHSVSFTYNNADGQLASSTDMNGQPTYYTYSDLLGRLTLTSYPDTGNTSNTYSTSCAEPSQTSIAVASGVTDVESYTLDGLCHLTQAAQTSDPQGTDYVNTGYEGSGRAHTATNPFRTTSDTSYGTTTTSHDPFGRTVSVAYADGSTATTTYSGLCSTVTDAAGKSRTLCKNMLGRLTSVTENGLGYTTSYTFDLLDDLTGVSQSGQPRTFVYDSLKRMTSSTNPENGTTSYTYDANSNLSLKTDARSIYVSYSYDALNRVTRKYFSDNSAGADFYYDETTVHLDRWTSPTLQNTNGRLTHTYTNYTQNPYSATVQDYDVMGRVQHYWQCTPLNCGTSTFWTAAYNYDLAGDVTSWNHPAGFTITQSFDAAMHVTQVTSSLSDSTHPATLATGPGGTIGYNPWGGISQLQNGCAGSGCANVQETYVYNKRMQMAVAEIGTASNHALDSCRVYNFYAGASNVAACSESPSAWPSGSNDNGNVAGYFYSDSMNSGLSHSAIYQYDAVNRLTSAAASGNSTYSQSYSYDAFGNLTCTPSGPGCVALTYASSTTTNHITTSGYTYDAAGNVTGDGTNTYQWDAEERLIKVVNGGGTAIQTNTYNALGQRVRSVNSINTTDEAFGAGGELLWRYTGSSSDPNQRAFVSFDHGILAEYYSGGTIFDHPEELGSMSTSSDYTGNNFNEKLFYPFGESWTGSAIPNFNTHQTFAQLPDYDPETDEYNTLNRHYSPSGRWMSPDPGGVKIVKLEDPQTWNMYAYARNNPTTLTDPSGLCPAYSGGVCPEGSKDGQPITATTTGTTTAAQNSAQNTPLSSVTILGNKVGITYSPNLTDAQRLGASDAISAAAGLLNQNASKLSPDETKAVGEITSFTVSGPKTQLGATGKGSMTLSIGYIHDSSAAWLGSLFGHEGQHYLNAGKYSGANLWGDEQSAGRTQLGIGNKIGFSSSESQHLEEWIDDKNRPAMQDHMEQGYTY